MLTAMRPALVPGAQILDVGAGRRPALPPDERPPGSTYVGLDLSVDELQAAPEGSYDEAIEGDLTRYRPELADRFDLAIAWQVLEHVENLEPALENLRSYLKPGGRLVALLSGRYAAFALVNRAVPQQLGNWATRRLLNREPDSVFEAHYDACDQRSLRRLLGSWSEVRVTALYRGAVYFRFSPWLQRRYLAYENWAHRTKRSMLATHYRVVVRR